jgi:DNA processing protein
MSDCDTTGTDPKTTVDETRLARAALTWLVEPGSRDLHALVTVDGPIRAMRRLVTGDLPPGALRGAAEARLRTADPWRVASAALAKAQRLGARLVIPEDDEWPARLDDLSRIARTDAEHRADRDILPPLCLWVRGPWPLAEALDRSVAVVGARAATSYGLHVAADFGYGLAERGWTVVSGGAYGIDAAAHRGALTAGGITVAVLACGVDRPYPASNTGLFDRIAERGLLVSEWPPGSAPFRHRFLQRLHECRVNPSYAPLRGLAHRIDIGRPKGRGVHPAGRQGSRRVHQAAAPVLA